VSYDDTWSFAEKVKFAKQSGMAGCFTWSLDQVRLILKGLFSSGIILFLGRYLRTTAQCCKMLFART
jgi:GH18 family chitinase